MRSLSLSFLIPLVLVRGVPQRSADGSLMRWYGVHIDIEEQQREQQRVLVAQEGLRRFAQTLSMGEMAASIAHELHQPLTQPPATLPRASDGWTRTRRICRGPRLLRAGCHAISRALAMF